MKSRDTLLWLGVLWLLTRNSKASASSPGFVPGGGRFGGGGASGKVPPEYPEAPDLPVQKPIPPNPLKR